MQRTSAEQDGRGKDSYLRRLECLESYHSYFGQERHDLHSGKRAELYLLLG